MKVLVDKKGQKKIPDKCETGILSLRFIAGIAVIRDVDLKSPSPTAFIFRDAFVFNYFGLYRLFLRPRLILR